MLENYIEHFVEIKEQIELITGDKMFKYDKDFLRQNDKYSSVCINCK